MASGVANPCLTIIYAYQESGVEPDFLLDTYIAFTPTNGNNS